MDLGPVDEFLVEIRGKKRQVEAVKNASKADIDGLDLPEMIFVSGEKDVGHSSQTMACDVDDLRIEHITYQQEFIVSEVKHTNVHQKGGRSNIWPQTECGVVEVCDVISVHKE